MHTNVEVTPTVTAQFGIKLTVLDQSELSYFVDYTSTQLIIYAFVALSAEEITYPLVEDSKNHKAFASSGVQMSSTNP